MMLKLFLKLVRRWTLDLFGEYHDRLSKSPGSTKEQVLSKITEALNLLRADAESRLYSAKDISEQLMWCQKKLLGQPVTPGSAKLTMGFMATREYDMWGNEPRIAALVNEIERECLVLIPDLETGYLTYT
jgi:hypothetical protein